MTGILGILYGEVTQPAFPIYASLEKTRDKQLAAFEQQPSIEREVAYFLETAPEIETVDAFVDDYRLMTVALSAFGLEDEIQYLGRMKKVLSESPTDEDALVNQLIDPRFKKIAEAFAFGDLGVANLSDSSFLEDIVDKFKTNEFEKYLGEQNPALREAEYFKRNIGSIENTFNILGDAVLRSVVLYTLDLPREIALQSVDKQKDLIDARVDIEDFNDPDYVEELVRRFLILKDADAAGSGSGATSTELTLLRNVGGGVNLLV